MRIRCGDQWEITRHWKYQMISSSPLPLLTWIQITLPKLFLFSSWGWGVDWVTEIVTELSVMLWPWSCVPSDCAALSVLVGAQIPKHWSLSPSEAGEAAHSGPGWQRLAADTHTDTGQGCSHLGGPRPHPVVTLSLLWWDRETTLSVGQCQTEASKYSYSVMPTVDLWLQSFSLSLILSLIRSHGTTMTIDNNRRTCNTWPQRKRALFTYVFLRMKSMTSISFE